MSEISGLCSFKHSGDLLQRTNFNEIVLAAVLRIEGGGSRESSLTAVAISQVKHDGPDSNGGGGEKWQDADIG